MRLYNLLTRTGDFITYSFITAFGLDSIRHVFIGGEQNYQIAALEAICALGIGTSKYFGNKTDKWMKNLKDTAGEMQRSSLSFIAKTDQLTAEWRDKLKEFGSYLEDNFDDF